MAIPAGKCIHCGVEWPSVSGRGGGQKKYCSKKCKRSYKWLHKEKGNSSYRDYMREVNREWMRNQPKDKRDVWAGSYLGRNYEILKKAKDAGCAHCGFSDHRALVFHHRDPSEKEMCVSHAYRKGSKALLAEIAKCEVLCSNCHLILHYDEGEKRGLMRNKLAS